MSAVVRLQVPPFEPAAPTSLAALRRPLIEADSARCDAHCQPCPNCEAAQTAEVEQAKNLASDLGLRLSQLVEDALTQHVARLEAQQVELVETVLQGVLPHLADKVLRRALADEIAEAGKPLRSESLYLRKNPGLDLGPLSEDTRLKIEDDAVMPMHQLQLREGAGTTQIDAGRVIEACLARLGSLAPETSS